MKQVAGQGSGRFLEIVWAGSISTGWYSGIGLRGNNRTNSEMELWTDPVTPPEVRRRTAEMSQ